VWVANKQPNSLPQLMTTGSRLHPSPMIVKKHIAQESKSVGHADKLFISDRVRYFYVRGNQNVQLQAMLYAQHLLQHG
jgi:hypothetical protein